MPRSAPILGSGPAWSDRLQVLLQAALALAGEAEIEEILTRIVKGAADVADARYAALATYDGTTITRFVHHGMEAGRVGQIGHLPQGRGLLGAVLTADAPIRLDDLSLDPRAHGLPAGHPPMRTFLGVPVGRRDRRYGNLYLTEKHHGGTFDDDDEALIVTLAAFAAGAIESAMLVDAQRDRTKAVAAQAAAEERDRMRREMLGQIIDAQEAERARVARDLHDDVGQALTSVLLGIRLIEGAVGSEPRIEEVRTRVADLRGLVADALRRTRQVAFDLRPTVLDDIGLTPALERLSDDLATRTGLTIELTNDLPEERLPPEVETVLYRVVQEALTNVVRHARASTARVGLDRHGSVAVAVVKDDGQGFDPTDVAHHVGLEGMAERARLIGGHLAIAAEPGAGTSVTVEVPVD